MNNKGEVILQKDGWKITRNNEVVAIWFEEHIRLGLSRDFVETVEVSFEIFPKRGLQVNMMGQPIMKLPNPRYVQEKQ